MYNVSSYCKQTESDLAALEGKTLKVEVIADDSGKFCSNGLRFDNVQKALDYGADLSSRWMLVREFRVAVAEPAEIVK